MGQENIYQFSSISNGSNMLPKGWQLKTLLRQFPFSLFLPNYIPIILISKMVFINIRVLWNLYTCMSSAIPLFSLTQVFECFAYKIESLSAFKSLSALHIIILINNLITSILYLYLLESSH